MKREIVYLWVGLVELGGSIMCGVIGWRELSAGLLPDWIAWNNVTTGDIIGGSILIFMSGLMLGWTILFGFLYVTGK